MISKFKNNGARKSALIYLSNFEQVKELYEDDKEMAGELAISIMEMALTGEISSNNKIIRLMLKNFEVSSYSGYISYTSPNDISEVMDCLRYNDYQDEDSDFLTMALIYGTASELMYTDTEGKVAFG